MVSAAPVDIVVSWTGRPNLWAPYTTASGTWVAVVGRLAFDREAWELPRAPGGSGGHAAEIVARSYEALGPKALELLNGNAAVLVRDGRSGVLHVRTDPAGALPVFETAVGGAPLLGTHPDALADMAGVSDRVDETSLAEFILTGTVTPPFTYYESVRLVPPGTLLRLEPTAEDGLRVVSRQTRTFEYQGDPGVSEDELAEALAAALHRAVQRRTWPALGRVAIALSGGLDSRVVLASDANPNGTFAFSCFDRPGRELASAKAIAQACDTPFLALQRTPDYYAEYASEGVRISGGMGSFANNHFLGVLPTLVDQQAETLLTGCYCDYLFKGLPLNRQSHWFTGRERLGAFRPDFYFDHIPSGTGLARLAHERRASSIPAHLRNQRTDADVFELEVRRTFPLAYEGDNQQRLVPQRLLGWSPPFLDRDVLAVYQQVPYRFKLNRSLFTKVVGRLTPRIAVADANTGAPVGAWAPRQWLSRNTLRLERSARRLLGRPTHDGSWPDWSSYAASSPMLLDMWRRRDSRADDLFSRVLGPSALHDVDHLKRRNPFLFVGLLTVKLWLRGRA